MSDTTSDAVLKDELICVEKKKIKITLRRIVYWDSQKNKVFEFITNHLELEPDKVADIYKHRWQIETMFKRLKQNAPQILSWRQPKCHRNIDIVWSYYSITYVGNTKKNQMKMGILKYGINGQVSSYDRH